mmetsp:Transcript_61780/g.143744  ORF Transcript_61780/g.143744 Transcript_61780/m.143744 type:complete len:402 (+) Transcript_61780:58-1263(+)
MGLKSSRARPPAVPPAASLPPGSKAEVAPLRQRGQRRWWMPGCLRLLRHGYQELVDAVVRPPRAEYSSQDLGPPTFRLGGQLFERSDLTVVGAGGLTLACSWWQPKTRLAPELPCVVYMHGNASCRLEALDCLRPVLSMGLTLFAFDFAGCGLSQGEHITLGYREKDDARAVVEFLRASGTVSTIALWGRSMGAATALLHGHRDPSIAAMVLDSPFTSLEQLAREVIDRAQLRHKPRVLIGAALRLLRASVKRKAGLDILRLRPIEDVHRCFVPAFFVAGRDDQFIPPHHATAIFERYAGDKDMILVAGGHNSQRPPSLLHSVSLFLYHALCVPAGLPCARPTPEPAPMRRPERVRELIRSELAAQNAVERLVGEATSDVQSTLPDRASVAEGLQAMEMRI